MTTILSIQADLLQNTASIPYKYGVQNCMSGKVTSEFEVLHGAPTKGSSFVNRCLIIPTASFQRGGMHYIHGTILHTSMCVLDVHELPCYFVCTSPLLATN